MVTKVTSIQSTIAVLKSWGLWARQDDINLGYPRQSAEQAVNSGPRGFVENEYPNDDIRAMDVTVEAQPDELRGLLKARYIHRQDNDKIARNLQKTRRWVEDQFRIAIHRVDAMWWSK